MGKSGDLVIFGSELVKDRFRTRAVRRNSFARLAPWSYGDHQVLADLFIGTQLRFVTYCLASWPANKKHTPSAFGFRFSSEFGVTKLTFYFGIKREAAMEYKCVATSLEGLVQQLSISYVGRGYWYYTTGHIDPQKDPYKVDKKLIEKYDITAKKWVRAKRKEKGYANLQYIRFGCYFVILATEGEHVFKERERNQLRDFRRNAVRFGGYQIAFRNGHVQVRLDDETYQLLKAYYVDLATRRNKEFMISEFYKFPFEPYAPIRRQAFNILRQVNRVRKTAGYEAIPSSAIWLKRKIVKPFEEIEPIQ